MDFTTEELFKYIGKNIKTLRKQQGIDVQTLAEVTSIADGSIMNIESGAPVSLPVLVSIARVLKVSIDALVYDFNFHSSPANVNPADMVLFVETYTSSAPEQKQMLMENIELYHRRTK